MNNHYKICWCCHRPFTASRSDQRYCSRRCWHRGNYAYAETLTKVCPVCGKMFETPRTNIVFCGKDCGNAGMKMLGKYTPTMSAEQKAEIVSKCHVVLGFYYAYVARAASNGDAVILRYQREPDDKDDAARYTLFYPSVHTLLRDPYKVVAEMEALAGKRKTIGPDAVVIDDTRRGFVWEFLNDEQFAEVKR